MKHTAFVQAQHVARLSAQLSDQQSLSPRQVQGPAFPFKLSPHWLLAAVLS